ncbi:MAG: aerial mycelium formation protein [Acidimicrobiales bacterium]
MIPELERVLDASYVTALAERTTDELREMRAECNDLENGLSYVRRMAQGRIDLLNAEVKRLREDAGDGDDVADLVDRLPEVLSDRDRPAGSGRVIQDLEPPEHVVEPLEARLDAVVGPGIIASISDLDATELSAAIAALRDLEAELSESRSRLHLTIDSVNSELADRYRSGEIPTG